VNADPTMITAYQALGAWLAIGLAGFGAWLGEGSLVASAMDAVLRNPANKWKIMAYMILFVALVESVAIYWFIVALNLLG
jgi:F-type H+-transporting ATPase subunit c